MTGIKAENADPWAGFQAESLVKWNRFTFGETLAAAVVAVMYSGGTFLESFAEGHARREMQDLLSRVPRTATRTAAISSKGSSFCVSLMFGAPIASCSSASPSAWL
ncbi:hypothetical protein [Chelativorans alearense]|uniref:hypothetical protein n=1 Tax=Chelativorans alearense TaxID=2681495 RepID=UPI0013D30D0B|nr:hypothetical protein [Chelativorans alearense]